MREMEFGDYWPPRLSTVGAAIGTLAVVAFYAACFLVWGIGFEAVIVSLCFLAGVALVPAWSFVGWTFAGYTVGNLLTALGIVTLGRTALAELPDGQFAMKGVEERDGQYHLRHDGEWWPIKDEESNWSRFWFMPFCVTYIKDSATFAPYNSQVSTGSEDADSWTETLLGEERGGYKSFVTRPLHGYHIDMHRVCADLKNAASTMIAQNAKQEALEDHGGNTAQLSGVYLHAMYVLCIVLGAATGLIAFGWF